MLQNIGPYLAIITAIIAAYLTYRNQLRLKAFELLHERRQSVLNDIEVFLNNLYKLQLDIKKGSKSEPFEKYINEYFPEGLILFHKVKGANFGGISDIMAETFWSVIKEPSSKGKPMSLEDLQGWVSRTINILSALYGFSHRQLTNELEQMAFSPVSRFIKKHKGRVKRVTAESEKS